jgi:type VI protein secretion system component VasK
MLLNDGGMEPQLNSILAEVAKQVPPFKIADRIPDYAKVLTGPAQVPGEFTKRGAEIASAIIEGGNWGSAGESCVTGSNAVAATVQSTQSKNQLRDLYYLRYAQAWRTFLNGVSVQPYGNIRDAAAKLQILGGSQSPLLAVVKIVAENTQFPEKAGEVSRWAAVESTAQTVGLGSLVDKFKKAQKGAEQVQAAVVGPTGLTASDVTKLFQPAQITTPPAMPVLVSEGNQPYANGLRGLQQNIDALSRAAEAEKATLIPQAQQSLAAARAGLQTLADKFADTGNQGLNGELGQLLTQPIQLADNIVPRNAVTLTAGKQNADLAQMCSAIRPVLQKYPFNPQAPDSNVASPQDISRVFAPTVGLVWQYQQKSLAEMVAKQGSAWVADPKAKVTPSLIAFLTASQQLSDIFFGGTNLIQPRVKFTLRSSGQNRVKLVLDGKELNPTLQTEFQWPGAGNPGAEGYVYIGDTAFPFAKYSGMWGIFRLFQNAEERALGERNVRWTQVRGAGNAEAQKLPVPAVVQFVGELPGGADLFNPKFFDALRCPSRAVEAQ